MKVLPRLLPVLLLYLLWTGQVISAQNQTDTLNISQPPEGELSREALKKVAKDIRKLERNPLASDADVAIANLITWITGSPDIHFTLCPAVVSPIMNSGNPYANQLLSQYILSSAATKIEQPDRAGDMVFIHTEGMKAAVKSYQLIKDEKGRDARMRYMNKLSRKLKRGKFENYMSNTLQECQ